MKFYVYSINKEMSVPSCIPRSLAMLAATTEQLQQIGTAPRFETMIRSKNMVERTGKERSSIFIAVSSSSRTENWWRMRVSLSLVVRMLSPWLQRADVLKSLDRI